MIGLLRIKTITKKQKYKNQNIFHNFENIRSSKINKKKNIHINDNDNIDNVDKSNYHNNTNEKKINSNTIKKLILFVKVMNLQTLILLIKKQKSNESNNDISNKTNNIDKSIIDNKFITNNNKIQNKNKINHENKKKQF